MIELMFLKELISIRQANQNSGISGAIAIF